MNIGIDIYKNVLRTTEQQNVNVIKKVKYILSKLATTNQDTVSLILDDFLMRVADDKSIQEFKKIINMIIYMIQTDKLYNCYIYTNCIVVDNNFENIYIYY